MEIRVKTSDFLNVVRRQLTGSSAVLGLMVEGNTLTIQLAKDIVYNETIPCEVVTNDGLNSVTAYFDKFINFLSPNEAYTNISLNEEMVSLRQGMEFSVLYKTAPESFVVVKSVECNQTMNSVTLEEIAWLTRDVMSIAKANACYPKNVYVIDGLTYLAYSNFIVRRPTRMADFCFSYDDLNKLSTILKNHDTISYGLTETDKLCLKLSDTAYVYIDSLRLDMSPKISFEQCVAGMEYIGEFLPSQFLNKTKTVCGILTKGVVTLCIAKDDIDYFINTASVQVAPRRSDASYVLHMTASMGQVLAVSKLLGEGKVKIYRKGDVLCLEQGTTQLILSGLIY